MNLSHRSDRDLLADVNKFVGSHRELTAKLVAHLAEIEERRLHLQSGFSSLFEFCVKALRLSEGEAFRRILAARLGRRFPIVYSLLAAGDVHLSSLELLRQWLTDENHKELLDAARGKSKRDIEIMLAARFPRPDAASRITRTRIEPLSVGRFRVEFTADEEFRQKLELCCDLLSHANPSRDIGVVVGRAIDLLLDKLEQERLARRSRPRRKRSPPGSKPGRVTSATRREVYERDGFRCTFVSPDGRRCEARAFLELDHALPRALGGGHEPENLRVLCRAHNQLAAEQVFGREVIVHHRHLRRQKCQARGKAPNGQPQDRTGGESVLLEKVRQALRKMGFQEAQAKRAIAEVQRMREGRDSPKIEQVLRDALLAATAASVRMARSM